MDKTEVDQLLIKLKCSSASTVHAALIDVRTKLIKSKNGVTVFRERGGLKFLVYFLKKPNMKIVDISLSILGNCSMEEETRTQVRKLGGLSPLLTILTSLESDSIQSRVCRTLGNLAQDPKNAQLLVHQGALRAIVKVIEEKENEETRQMAIRALRLLADSPRHKQEVVKEDGIRAIAELLKTENTELLKAVVKALAHFTYNCSTECAQQVTGDGSGLQTLVDLTSNPDKMIKESALLAVINLTHEPSILPPLGNAGAINIVIAEMKELLVSKESHGLMKYVCALCNFCSESVNRVKIREGGGLHLFVQLLQDWENRAIREKIIHSLLHFLYDEASLELLRKEGLIPNLVDHVKRYNMENRIEHEKKTVEDEHDSTVQVGSVMMPLAKDDIAIGNSVCDLVETQADDLVQDQQSEHELQSKKTPKEVNENKELKDCEERENMKKKASAIKEKELRAQTFHVNSPSYQQIQYELEQYLSLRPRDEPKKPLQYGDWSPSSPSSLCYSPTCSPLSWSPLSLNSSQNISYSPGFSPGSAGQYSPGKSTSCSPVYSDISPQRLSVSSQASPAASPNASPTYHGHNPTSVSSHDSDSVMRVSPYHDNESCYSPVYEEEIIQDFLQGDCNLSIQNSTSFVGENTESGIKEKKCQEEKNLESNKKEKEHSSVLFASASETFSVVPDEKVNSGSMKYNRKREWMLLEKNTGGSRKLPVKRIKSHPCSAALSSQTDEKNMLLVKTSECTVDSVSSEKNVKGLKLRIPTSTYSKDSEMNCPQNKSDTCSESGDSSQAELASQGRHTKKNEKQSVIAWVLSLLSRYSQMERPGDDMVSTTCFQALLDYLILTPDPLPRAGRIIARLSRNIYCLFPLLKQHFIPVLHKRLCCVTHEDCIVCHKLQILGRSVLTNLSMLGESGYGEGEMAHLLLMGTNSEKLDIAIAIPFIVRLRKLLRKLLIKYNGLEILLNAVLETEERQIIFQHAVCSLHQLAAHIGIITPNLEAVEEAEDGDSECKFQESMVTKDTEFVLDNGMKLKANREVLSSASSVFAAMLHGYFVESFQQEIIFPHTSHEALNYIIHYSYGCTCPQLHQQNLTIMLELLAFSDKYLMTELHQKLTTEIVHKYMQSLNLLEIYEAGVVKSFHLESTQERLGESIISYILVGDINVTERVQLFKMVMSSKCNKDILEDIRHMIWNKLMDV